MTGNQTHSGCHLMGFTTQLVQHGAGLFLIGWFAEHFLSYNNHGIGCNDKFVIMQGRQIGVCFLLRDKSCHLIYGKRWWITLVDVGYYPYLKIHINACK